MSQSICIDGQVITVDDDDPRVVPQTSVALPPAPPPVSGDAIIGALSPAQAAQVDVRDLARIAYRDDVPAGNAKLARIAKALGTTPDALRAAAAA